MCCLSITLDESNTKDQFIRIDGETSSSSTMPSSSSQSIIDNSPPTKRIGKVLKVIKMKRSKGKHWNRLDSGNEDKHKWIPVFEHKKKRLSRKSSKQIVCLHVKPSKHEQTKIEAFNLIRKCYTVKHIKRTEAHTTLDTSSVPNYSPIIDPNQLLVRSPMMDSSRSAWPQITNVLESKVAEPVLDEHKNPSPSDVMTTILPSVGNETDLDNNVYDATTTEEQLKTTIAPQITTTSSSILSSSAPNYLNLYEYQTTNPLIDQSIDTNVDKPLIVTLNEVSVL